jgi:hypothetical protein
MQAPIARQLPDSIDVADTDKLASVCEKQP